MNLIKTLFCMLALALVVGVLTSGSQDNADAEEPGPVPGTGYWGEEVLQNNNSLNESPAPGGDETAGTAVLNEAGESEKNLSFLSTASKNVISVVPGPPASGLLENGSGEIAVRKRFLESRTGAAASLIEEEGEEAFSEFREEGSAWRYGDFYYFVGSLDGTLLVYPPNGSKEGMDLKGLLDSEGKPIGELFLEIALSEKGEGWVYYEWPGSSGLSRKYAFIKRAHGKEQTYFIGTGFYPEECIISRNLEECEVLEQEANICFSELFNPENFDRKPELECSIIHSELGPGKSLASRRLEASEALYVLEGEGLLYLDDVPVKLRPGQLVYVPRGSFRTVYNTGNTSLLFLSVNRSGPGEESEELFA